MLESYTVPGAAAWGSAFGIGVRRATVPAVSQSTHVCSQFSVSLLCPPLEMCFGHHMLPLLNNNDETTLAADFRPGPCDVICQRGKVAHDHNLHFRKIISDNFLRYTQSCPSKVEKSNLVISIVRMIRGRSPRGGFVKFCGTKMCWVEIGDRTARQKVAHAFRSMILRNKKQHSPELSQAARIATKEGSPPTKKFEALQSMSGAQPLILEQKQQREERPQPALLQMIAPELNERRAGTSYSSLPLPMFPTSGNVGLTIEGDGSVERASSISIHLLEQKQAATASSRSSAGPNGTFEQMDSLSTSPSSDCLQELIDQTLKTADLDYLDIESIF